ncbi:hypothetical protein [Burkholderia sp. Z1]|uniref:hypothetical protein n=1 Tax=Burkholderia sp. Z1 TaxID=2759039 RepID=UPI00186814D7|nr:hypothetical protein [Burkholderia sp. Z1]
MIMQAACKPYTEPDLQPGFVEAQPDQRTLIPLDFIDAPVVNASMTGRSTPVACPRSNRFRPLAGSVAPIEKPITTLRPH